MIQPRSTRIIGIDPGLRRTGWGVIEICGSRLSFVDCGVVTTVLTGTLAERLVELYDGIAAIIERTTPDVAAVEQTFVNKDPVATLKLGQARAIALLVPARAGLHVAEYAPNQVKKSVVGVGHAEKEQVHVMVKMLLPQSNAQSADAADALAVAITHAHMAETTARMDAMVARAR
ncbi:MAG: crossover junction endodeoxyribonuclease RuvC [Alphaproteobacteria bacterium]|nr:crossover junction endodeoxyribonuclease RuvC [Alphaproteobacteria bacterium]